MGKFTVFAILLCTLICYAVSEGDKKDKVDLDDYIEKGGAKEELATAETGYYPSYGHGYHAHGYHGGYGHHGYSPYHGHGHAHTFYRGYHGGHGHGHGHGHYGHVGSAHVSYGSHIHHPPTYHHHHGHGHGHGYYG